MMLLDLVLKVAFKFGLPAALGLLAGIWLWLTFSLGTGTAA